MRPRTKNTGSDRYHSPARNLILWTYSEELKVGCPGCAQTAGQSVDRQKGTDSIAFLMGYAIGNGGDDRGRRVGFAQVKRRRSLQGSSSPDIPPNASGNVLAWRPRADATLSRRRAHESFEQATPSGPRPRQPRVGSIASAHDRPHAPLSVDTVHIIAARVRASRRAEKLCFSAKCL